MRKPYLSAAAAVVLLVALYAGLGYWLAPRLLVDQLRAYASSRGFDLSIDSMRVDPFHLVATAEGVRVSHGSERLGSLRRFTLDLALSSVWQRTWVIDSARIDAPHVAVAVSDKGRLNWAPTQGSAPRAAAKRPPILLRRLVLADGVLDFTDRSRGAPVALHLEPVHAEIDDVATFGSHTGRYTFGASTGQGGEIRSSGTLALAPVSARGTLELRKVALDAAFRLAAPRAAAPRGALRASASYAYRDRRAVLQNVAASVEGFDWPVAPGRLELKSLELKIPKLAWPLKGPFPVSAQADVRPSGKLSAHGTLALSPVGGSLEVSADSVPIALAQPWVSPHARVQLAAGTLSGQGTLALGGHAQFKGSVDLAGPRLDEQGNKDLLFAADRLQAPDATLGLSPASLHIVELLARAPHGRVLVSKGGRVNVIEAFKGAAAGDATGKRLAVTVERLRVEGGTLDLSDRSIEPNFSTTMHDLQGIASRLSTNPADVAQVQLDGRVARYGEARIRGTLTVFAPKSRTNLLLHFRNLGLASFSPYVQKFAGYQVKGGRLTADLRYRVRDSRLQGENQIIVDELQLGKRVASASAKDIPLELAAALLTDSQGRMKLGIPVSGDLRNPKFDLGSLFAKATANVLQKVASAPFRLLASLVKGQPQSFDRLLFPAGSARLEPAQLEKVDALARALAQRPRLRLRLVAGYDPQADGRALRETLARRKVAERAGYKVGAGGQAPIDLADPRARRAAEALFLENGGSRAQLASMRRQAAQAAAGGAAPGSGADARRYVRGLLDAIATKITIPPGLLRQLAELRGDQTRSALAKQGISAARIAVSGPSEVQASRREVPLSLSLAAGRG